MSEFDEATAVTALGPGLFRADLDAGWGLGNDVLNGGYLLAVLARATLADTGESAPHHLHPTAISAAFVRPGMAGTADVRVDPGPSGRTVTHRSVAVGGAAGDMVTALVTTATLPLADALAPTAPSMPAPEECVSMLEKMRAVPGGMDLLPTLMQRVDLRFDPATAGWLDGVPSSEPVLRAWCRIPGREPDPLALVLFADLLPPSGFAQGNLGWAPTVQIQTLVRAVPAPGWCLIEIRGGTTADGWIDEDCTIWDSGGRLVAQSRQLARVARG